MWLLITCIACKDIQKDGDINIRKQRENFDSPHHMSSRGVYEHASLVYSTVQFTANDKQLRIHVTHFYAHAYPYPAKLAEQPVASDDKCCFIINPLPGHIYLHAQIKIIMIIMDISTLVCMYVHMKLQTKTILCIKKTHVYTTAKHRAWAHNDACIDFVRPPCCATK